LKNWFHILEPPPKTQPDVLSKENCEPFEQDGWIDIAIFGRELQFLESKTSQKQNRLGYNTKRCSSVATE